MSDGKNGGILDSVTNTSMKFHNLSLGIASMVAGVILIAVVCAGTVNIGGGKMIGGIGKNFFQILDEAAHEAFGIPADQPISMFGWAPETTVKGVFNSTPAPEGDVQATTPAVPTAATPGVFPTPVPPTPGVDPALEAERIKKISDTLISTRAYWIQTGDWDGTIGSLTAVQFLFKPGETYNMYNTLYAEAMNVKVANDQILPDWQALIDAGNPNPDDEETVKRSHDIPIDLTNPSHLKHFNYVIDGPDRKDGKYGNVYNRYVPEDDTIKRAYGFKGLTDIKIIDRQPIASWKESENVYFLAEKREDYRSGYSWSTYTTN